MLAVVVALLALAMVLSALLEELALRGSRNPSVRRDEEHVPAE